MDGYHSFQSQANARARLHAFYMEKRMRKTPIPEMYGEDMTETLTNKTNRV